MSHEAKNVHLIGFADPSSVSDYRRHDLWKTHPQNIIMLSHVHHARSLSPAAPQVIAAEPWTQLAQVHKGAIHTEIPHKFLHLFCAVRLVQQIEQCERYGCNKNDENARYPDIWAKHLVYFTQPAH